MSLSRKLAVLTLGFSAIFGVIKESHSYQLPTQNTDVVGIVHI